LCTFQKTDKEAYFPIVFIYRDFSGACIEHGFEAMTYPSFPGFSQQICGPAVMSVLASPASVFKTRVIEIQSRSQPRTRLDEFKLGKA